MDIQRLRNLTTGFLHTKMDDIYCDIDHLTGIPGVMTHQLPEACEAIRPWLREQAPDERLWDRRHDPSHVGEIDVRPMTSEESSEFMRRFNELPSLLEKLGTGRPPHNLGALTR